MVPLLPKFKFLRTHAYTKKKKKKKWNNVQLSQNVSFQHLIIHTLRLKCEIVQILRYFLHITLWYSTHLRNKNKKKKNTVVLKLHTSVQKQHKCSKCFVWSQDVEDPAPIPELILSRQYWCCSSLGTLCRRHTEARLRFLQYGSFRLPLVCQGRLGTTCYAL